AMSHITGGGLASNVGRVVPDRVSVRIDRSTWSPAPVFDLVASLGAVAREDLEQTLNMGVGMVAVCTPEAVDGALALLKSAGISAWVCGSVDDRPGGTVELVSESRCGMSHTPVAGGRCAVPGVQQVRLSHDITNYEILRAA